jgi:site-specific DNA-methyltransferase (adenine-specific)
MIEPTWQGEGISLYTGDSLIVMADFAPDSFDSIVTDPPYGLEFMGKEWDKLAKPKPGNIGGFADGNKPSFERVKRYLPAMQEWHYNWAVEALRVAKPGARLLAFGGTRTWHRLACALEDAGWEIRDTIMWVYGSGFSKSHDISKAIDKMAGAIGVQAHGFNTAGGKENYDAQDKSFRSDYGYSYAPATDAARQWEGWGTALKPAWEPIIVARKPVNCTVAENVLQHGTGAINIDACRVQFADDADEHEAKGKNQHGDFGSGPMTNQVFGEFKQDRANYDAPGRWPANLIHDGSDEVMALFPQSSVTGKRSDDSRAAVVTMTKWLTDNHSSVEYGGDTGSAARFFYCAKASRQDRDEGLEGMAAQRIGHNLSTNACARCGKRVKHNGSGDGCECGDLRETIKLPTASRNHHPTVKPTALMRYLCRLVTPPGGVVLDLFMGSGSTGKAAVLEGFRFVGIDTGAEYVDIAVKRIKQAQAQMRMPL